MFIASISKEVFYNRYKRENECFTRTVSHEKTRLRCYNNLEIHICKWERPVLLLCMLLSFCPLASDDLYCLINSRHTEFLENAFV